MFSVALTFCVVSLGPVVSGSGLSEDEVIGSEELTERSSSDRVHGTGFEVNKNGPWDVLAAGGFVVVNVDTLQLRKNKSFLNIILFLRSVFAFFCIVKNKNCLLQLVRTR